MEKIKYIRCVCVNCGGKTLDEVKIKGSREEVRAQLLAPNPERQHLCLKCWGVDDGN